MSACSSTQVPFVHRMEIPQGNVVTKDMVEKLEPGLTKRQVTYIMGSPMLVDVFNQEQWVYIYSFEPSSGERVQRQLSLGFEDDALVRVSGDVDVITETSLAVQSAQGKSRSVDVPEGVGAGYNDGGILQGVIDRFKGLNPWSGKDGQETAQGKDQGKDQGDDQDSDPGKGSGAQPPAATADTGRDTMQKFSLEEKDIGTVSPPDAAREAPAAANGGDGEETGPIDDSSKGWRLKFGSDASNQAFAPTPRAADPPRESRPAASARAQVPARTATPTSNQPPQAGQDGDGPGFFSRLNSTLNPWADDETTGSGGPGPAVEAGDAADSTAGTGAGPEGASAERTETIRPVLRRSQPGERAPLPQFMAGDRPADAADSDAAADEYDEHRLIFDSPDLGVGDGTAGSGEDPEWTIRVKGPRDASPHQPFAPAPSQSSPQPDDKSE